MRKLIEFARNDDGATAVEYGIIALAIALVIVVAVDQAGTNMADGVYTDIGNLF
ncbi:MAG: Flp family type IVb pilin [Rhizobiales bacterium]|nr:Flp family type IVb pilin [Hyphomicrobiales bacterium]MBO6699880.1 Flp family type IVb pilin [Hyphomicrobiales bacterium]MBO6737418.1 Flp family type IVb pilin [Hyphomicrobiales bacterium]MBO6911508.1 Flp family type IVb pilin [Hyphomicrobiales bacterium]MBO6955192.1 Flp family type IVb pilin [Hyphomicrobiales bacterium]